MKSALLPALPALTAAAAERPHQSGAGHLMEDRGLDGGRGNLNRNWVPMAAALKPAGYMSYAAGKWHVEPVQPTQHPAGTLSSPRLAGAECQGCETAFDFPAGPGTMRALSLRLP